MLYIICMLVFLLPVLAGFGKIFQHFFGRLCGGVAASVLCGIFCVAVVFTLIAFFLPLNIYLESAAFFIGLVAFFYFKVYLDFWEFSFRENVPFFVFSGVAIFFGSYFPFILDHFGYYIPTLEWLTEVGLVKGISNLDLLLGQMSVWHIFQAGFSHFSDPFLRLNALVLIVYLMYVFEKRAWIQLVFVPFLFFFSQSPSPDLPAIAFSLIILNEIFLANKRIGLLFAFAVFACMLKPTMIWLPVFTLLYGIFILKKQIKFAIPGILLLFLFFFKNIWTFGFPIFPVPIFDMGFSWKPNPQILQNSAQMALQKTFDMQFSPQEIQHFSTLEYLKNWLFLSGIKGVLHISFVAALLVFLIFSVKKKSKLIWLLFFSVLLKSAFVLCFSAQYRFFLDVYFVVFFVLFSPLISRKWSTGIFALLTVFCFTILTFPPLVSRLIPSFKLGNFMGEFSAYQLYKPARYQLKKHDAYILGNLKFNVVRDYPFSFDTPLPAISPSFLQEYSAAGIFPQMRGKTLREGFIWQKIDPQDARKLKSILNKSAPPE